MGNYPRTGDAGGEISASSFHGSLDRYKTVGNSVRRGGASCHVEYPCLAFSTHCPSLTGPRRV